MVVINVVYYFGYCRNVAPPPPSSRRLCFHRRPARCAVESVLLILATGIDPIDRQQPAVFIFIGIVERKKPRETATTAIYRGNARPEFSSLKFQIRPP